MVITLIVYLVIKHHNYKNAAQVLLIMSFPFAYLLPIMNGLHLMEKHDFDQNNENMERYEIRVWIKIEVIYFFNYIFSLHLFMLISYLFKFKSITRRRADEAHA